MSSKRTGVQACQSQCKECPFRSTSLPGYLGGYDGPGAVTSSLWKGERFWCHTRAGDVYEQDNWLEQLDARGELCLGALVFVESARQAGAWPDPKDPVIVQALADAWAKYQADPERFDVMSPREFGEHHMGGMERFLAKRAEAATATPSPAAVTP